MKPHWKSALSAVCRVAVKHHIYKVVLFLCLSLSVQIPILFRCFHRWNLCNYSKGHRSTLVSRHNLRHWGSISVPGTPQPYLPFLKRGMMEKPGTHVLQVLLLTALRNAPAWEEQQWISAVTQALKVWFCWSDSERKNMFYAGSYFKTMQQFVN